MLRARDKSTHVAIFDPCGPTKKTIGRNVHITERKLVLENNHKTTISDRDLEFDEEKITEICVSVKNCQQQTGHLTKSGPN